MSGRRPYQMTLQDLRKHCRLLVHIEVIGGGSKHEELIGKNYLGEIVVRVRGKITPARVKEFNKAYTFAVAKGLIKAEPKGETSGEN